MFLAMAGLTVTFTLFGCDRNSQQAQAPAAAPVAAVTPPACNCSQGAQTASVAPVAHHHRHHRHHSLSENSYSSESYSSENSSSSSVGEYSPSEQDDVDSGEVETHVRTAHSQQDSGVWVDGYGRPHYVDYGPPDDEDPGYITRKDERRRMRPWRGYDSQCDNRID
jgi:hypothetical protein